MHVLLTRYRKLTAGVVAVLLTGIAAYCGYAFAYFADQIQWDCGGGSCATNDWRAVTMPGMILALIGACLLGGYVVGLIIPAIAIGLTSWAFRYGLDRAIIEGFTNPHHTRIPRTVTLIGFIISGLCMVGWLVMLKGTLRVRRAIRAREQRVSSAK